MAMPLKNSTSVRIDLPADLRDWIDATAKRRGMTRADYIRRSLVWIRNGGKKSHATIIETAWRMIEAEGLEAAKNYLTKEIG